MLYTLFDQEEVLRRWQLQIEREAAERGMAEGIEKGREKGMAEGIEKGMAEGIEKGREKVVAECVSALMKNLSMTEWEARAALGLQED